ncbi:hypothetical protein C8R43DRAFT_1083654 [Mycena crocata]|nr:hypothetical protein C8R43DRAFT_1083654 [Mycena crocata]
MPSALTAARMSYAAALVASIGYGIYVVLAYQCIKRLIRAEKWTTGRIALLAYTSLLFCLQTIYFVSGCKWSEMEFVEAQVDPAVFATQHSSTLALLKAAVYVVNIWVADAFILHRAYIIWGNQILVIPGATYLAAVGMGTGLLVEVSKPTGVLGESSVIDFGTPFWSLSVTTNVLSTLLIAGRLAYCRRRRHGAEQVGRHSHTSTSAIFAESAALYAVVALIYIPLWARNLALQYPFSALMGAVVSIAPTLIILRMAGGKAITKEWSNSASKTTVESGIRVSSMEKVAS